MEKSTDKRVKKASDLLADAPKHKEKPEALLLAKWTDGSFGLVKSTTNNALTTL